jgi:AGCS family alanine or glycine:cation symporter
VNIQNFVDQINGVLINWPLYIFVVIVSLICTVAFRFIQFKYFFYAWKQVLFPSKDETQKKASADMTPLQAFMNTLNANLGNGAIAGMAVAIFAGGPGAALWVVIVGLLIMVLRFAEVFLSMHYASENKVSDLGRLGGPMLYLRQLPAGTTIAWIYGALCFFFCLLGGNSAQAKSITDSLSATFGVAPVICAAMIGLFIVYVVYGGAARVVKLTDKITPLKVIIFFTSSLMLLAYHYKGLLSALELIWASAFSTTAIVGGVLGYTVQHAIRQGMSRSIFASESGLGTAAILFGHTGSKASVKDGIISMLSTFISTLVCFIVALCIVVSGAWTTGLTSTPLTIAAFSTLFGADLGGIIVSFLSISFGVGVLVSFVYITREVWMFLTGGRWPAVFSIIYCLFAVGGALLDVKLVWDAISIPMGLMLIINLCGILYLIPVIRRAVIDFDKAQS